jgi:UPF0271 protein
MRVDLNADVGEWSTEPATDRPAVLGQDPALMRVITSANIACGFHAGDPRTMRATLRLAILNGVSPGAHPGLRDPEGFGRKEIHIEADELEDVALYQIGALAALAAAEGQRLQHVKAHGAIYNMAARDAVLADALARATAAIDRSLIFFGLAGSELIRAGERAGLRTASEAFADRAYNADGSLVSRQQSGAVIHDPQTVVQRALRMVTDGEVEAVDGTIIPVRPDTICVHGDTPDAALLAARIREGFERSGIDVRSVGR